MVQSQIIIFIHLNDVLSISLDVDCGMPRPIPHSVMLWDTDSTFGSQVVYQCKPGYRNVGQGNISVCTASGKWDEASLLCQGDDDDIYLRYVNHDYHDLNISLTTSGLCFCCRNQLCGACF